MQYPFSVMPKVMAGLEATMSPARLNRFLVAPSTDKNFALRTYVWNARLCEEFYIPIQLTEVALRNGITKRLEQEYSSSWFTNHKLINNLPERHKESLRNIVADEQAKRGASFTADHVVAGLSFGFWQNLMGGGMSHILWKWNVKAAFPQAPANIKRQDIYDRLERLRLFRNAVMHHYAIFDKGPVNEYNNIRTLMHWMCHDTLWLMSELANPAAVISRRPRV